MRRYNYESNNAAYGIPDMTKTLADILRDRIAASGMSINAIAKASGVPQPALNWFFKGERDLTLRTANKLARYLGLEMRPKTVGAN
jgi:plasmid maintenance system antidote protein VapI